MEGAQKIWNVRERCRFEERRTRAMTGNKEIGKKKGERKQNAKGINEKQHKQKDNNK